MAHNHEADCSGPPPPISYPRKLTQEEAAALGKNILLVPPDWRLPHGWNISVGGYVVPPIPAEGLPLDTYI
jgi:hypothetical protein